MLNDNWHIEILTFWFEELTPKQWYYSTTELDQKIKQRFGELIPQLASTAASDLHDDPQQLLAAIIVLDQFTRNCYRGSPDAFKHDSQALKLTKHMVANHLDQQLTNTQKHFSYLPLMHSEKIEDQDQCLALITLLGNEDGIQAAVDHRDIIVEFGRYPHRNAVLGRESTEAEIKYLENGKRFGQ